MVTHMKTTIDIADPLLETAKRVAAREGVTLRTLVEQGLRHVLQTRKAGNAPFRLRPASFKGKGLQPEARRLGWDAIREMTYNDGSR
jgi:hypothetical protein